MSFLDFLLAKDLDGTWRTLVERDKADLAAGITWGVYDRTDDRLIETHPARYMAEAALRDNADCADRDESDYEIRQVSL